MEKEVILKQVAPCSLMCHTCAAYEEGIICDSARQLLKYMEGMNEFLQKHAPIAMDKHQIFEEELQKYALGKCPGCRSNRDCVCSIDGCYIPECTKQHNVNFCGECEEFPCSGIAKVFEPEVYHQWVRGNTEIRDKGVESYWENNKEKSHYIAYTNKE